MLDMFVFGFAFCNDFYFVFYWWPSLKTRNLFGFLFSTTSRLEVQVLRF